MRMLCLRAPWEGLSQHWVHSQHINAPHSDLLAAQHTGPHMQARQYRTAACVSCQGAAAQRMRKSKRAQGPWCGVDGAAARHVQKGKADG
jgi:hypothetical protein